jgi:acetyl-CoA acetyltransferase
LIGLTGIPFINVFNACATGAATIQQAANAILAGTGDIVVAVGMDKHPRGSFKVDPTLTNVPAWYGENGQFVTTKFFGMKINKYMHDYGVSPATLAKVAAKNYRNGALNPKAFRRKPISEEEILSSQVLNHPLTSYMFCAPDEGAAAVVLCRADIAHRYTDKPVYVNATAIRTRNYGAYEVSTSWAAVEEDAAPTVYASRSAYEDAGIGPEDVDVIQLQDTDAGAEVIHMAENGFCADGEQEKLLADGATEITGPMPTNTDGGLIANGEPIGASGLRQVNELVLQLRGQAGDRQVQGDPRVGYAQVYGAPGTAAVTILSR